MGSSEYPTPETVRVQTHTPTQLFKNGIEESYGYHDAVYAGNLTTIGSRRDSAILWYGGHIGEMIIYNRILNTEERQQVEQYLMDKWKVENNIQVSNTLSNEPQSTMLRFKNEILYVNEIIEDNDLGEGLI